MYVYTILVDIVWDPEKAKINLKKHGIHFSDAEIILSDSNALTREDINTKGERKSYEEGI